MPSIKSSVEFTTAVVFSGRPDETPNVEPKSRLTVMFRQWIQLPFATSAHILQITLLDHVIIGRKWFSFKEAGIL